MAKPIAAVWTDQELEGLQANYPEAQQVYGTKSSKYNPTPGAEMSLQLQLELPQVCCAYFDLQCRSWKDRLSQRPTKQLPILF